MSVTLKYWPGRGLMEVARIMYAVAGKFPNAGYTDGRYQDPTAAGDLSGNLGRMPICQVDDQSIGQSTAIYYYVAAETGLLGSSNVEAAQILAITEHVKELMAAWRVLVPYGTEPSAEKLDTWFKQGAVDATGPADGARRAERFCTWFLGRIEASLGSSGFAVGNKISLADVLLFTTFADVLADTECAADTAQWKKEPFGSLASTQATLAAFPKVKAAIGAVAANANVQQWLATRGMQYF